jgi:hypothetical protein
MYIKIPLRNPVDDTILSKSIIYKGVVVGIVTRYDDNYLYGSIWVKHNIESAIYNNDIVFSEVVLTDFWDEKTKEEMYGFNYGSR